MKALFCVGAKVPSGNNMVLVAFPPLGFKGFRIFKCVTQHIPAERLRTLKCFSGLWHEQVKRGLFLKSRTGEVVEEGSKVTLGGCSYISRGLWGTSYISWLSVMGCVFSGPIWLSVGSLRTWSLLKPAAGCFLFKFNVLTAFLLNFYP